MYYLCTPRQPAYCVFTALSGFLASLCLFSRVPFSYTAPTRLLRIYRILRIFSKSVPVLLCTFFVHCANPLTAYLPHSPDF